MKYSLFSVLALLVSVTAAHADPMVCGAIHRDSSSNVYVGLASQPIPAAGDPGTTPNHPRGLDFIVSADGKSARAITPQELRQMDQNGQLRAFAGATVIMVDYDSARDSLRIATKTLDAQRSFDQIIAEAIVSGQVTIENPLVLLLDQKQIGVACGFETPIGK